MNPKSSYGINPVTWAYRQEDADVGNFLDTSINVMEADGKFLEWEKHYDAHWLRPEFVLTKS